MSFLHPGYFLTFLALAPLIAMYLLKVRPTRKPVTAFFLWEAVFDQKKNTALFNRLRDLWSLLLLALALTAVTLALTEPQITGDRQKDLLLIIDHSASMNALDHGQSRLDAARKAATDILRGLNGNRQAAVASVGMDLRYESHFTTSPRTLLDAVRRIEPSDEPFRSEALANAVPPDMTIDQYRIILISDGCCAHEALDERIELIKIGTKQDNIGFVACDLQRLSDQPGQAGLYFRLASSFDRLVDTDVTLTWGPNDAIAKVIPVTVQPGINASEVYTLEAGEPGPWTATLGIDDALALDNRALMILQPQRPIRVQVVCDEPFFLTHSILAFARTSGDLTCVTDGADVVLASGVIPDAQQAVIFNPPEGTSWCGRFGSEVDRVRAQVQVQDHPVLRHCDIETLPFIGARQVELPEGSLVIAKNTDEVPLIYRVRDNERSALVINMDPQDSEFYYSAWFPVLVYNAAGTLMGRQQPLASAVPTGQSVEIPTLDLDNETTEVRINDQREAFRIHGQIYGPIRRIGFHSLNNRTGQWSFGADLFSPQETLLNNPETQTTANAIRRGRPMSVLLAGLAIALLLAEAILYHLRKVG
ncbi:MAG: BatA and WFA domain-containing protein [Phycisphaerae bacterium]|nr:BatA and WFA domain-containing protein [Phycisphaerae bacterium]